MNSEPMKKSSDGQMTDDLNCVENLKCITVSCLISSVLGIL